MSVSLGARVRSFAAVAAVILCGSGLALPSVAAALPWDIDLYRQQSYQAGEMPRSPVPGTVPVGGLRPHMPTEEAAAKLSNPTEFGRDSVWRGRRIWMINCLTCHGPIGDGKGPVGPAMGVPNILTSPYPEKPDGNIYGVLQNGGSNMPRYGFKLSEAEHWDVINYVRFLQGKDAPGIARPQ